EDQLAFLEWGGRVIPPLRRSHGVLLRVALDRVFKTNAGSASCQGFDEPASPKRSATGSLIQANSEPAPATGLVSPTLRHRLSAVPQLDAHAKAFLAHLGARRGDACVFPGTVARLPAHHQVAALHSADPASQDGAQGELHGRGARRG